MTGKEAVVTDLSSLEKALEELEGSFNGEALWWRGQSCETWELGAGVFRPSLKG